MELMELKAQLEILQEIKQVFLMHSDMSAKTKGYLYLCKQIEKLKSTIQIIENNVISDNNNCTCSTIRYVSIINGKMICCKCNKVIP